MSDNSKIRAYEESSRTTDTIRGVLANYEAGPNIFIELLQNADDARAGCAKFLLVEKEYPMPANAIFEDSMNAVMGAALYVYDDGLFTAKNQHDITFISSEGKRDDVSKTGKFGVGFRSVYHMTDVPHWVSALGLCYSDPLGQFVRPSAAQDRKGIQADLELLTQRADVFRHFSDLAKYTYHEHGAKFTGKRGRPRLS